MELALSPMERDAIVIYDERVRAGDTSDTPIWVDHFSRHIFRGVPDDGEVVDVGCRLGRVISILPELGIKNYVGIDPSSASIEYCKKQWAFTGCTFEVGEVRGLGATYPGRFSGFLMLAVLMHLPRTDLDKALASLRACLKPGAPGMFSTPFGFDDVLEAGNDSGMWLTLYTFDELEDAFTRNGFEVKTIFTPDDNMALGHVVAI